MQIKASLNNLRIAPRKVRLVANMLKGQSALNGLDLLKFSLKKGSLPIEKLLMSALANGRNNFQLQESDLFIRNIKVDEGPKLKRWRPASRGRGVAIQKKTSNISLILEGETFGQKQIKKEMAETIQGRKKQEDKRKKAPKTSFERERNVQDKAKFKKVFRRKAI